MGSERFRNLILRSLSDDVIERLELRPLTLELRKVIQQPGRKVDQILFIEEGIGSMTTSFSDGSQVECGMFGFEAAIGAQALLGLSRSINRIAMQVAGNGYAGTMEAAQREFRRCEWFHDLVQRSVMSDLLQASQTAGCNARHHVQQRLSRWLLQCCDRVTADVIHLTQEFMADMLGVERPAVSLVAGKLQERGLIEYSRGRVRITDRKGLESVACECYAVVRQERDEFAAFVESGGRR